MTKMSEAKLNNKVKEYKKTLTFLLLVFLVCLGTQRNALATELQNDPGEPLEEVTRWDRYNHGLSMMVAAFRSTNSSGNTALYAGLGLRYALTLGTLVFAQSNQLQDSFQLEAGLHAFQVNYSDFDDSYRVLPISGTLKYNLLLTENWGFFFYLGALFNQVTQLNSGTGTTTEQEANLETAKNNLGKVRVAFGTGLTLRLGPGWEVRTDVGLDLFGLGMVLRF